MLKNGINNVNMGFKKNKEKIKMAGKKIKNVEVSRGIGYNRK